ncbi:MAG: hypothetical protein DRI90_14485 [Deltaproteobacteria bacterium]|nr:MAG: hypothetical protein DRI90_14485 [Deltaproteobacteria bacterium]
MKIRTLKTLLWFLAGFGLVVVFLRILHGVGSVVALNDILPWGLWKGGGVVALVPIGGAGFTLAALVYVFHWKRYQPLARGAVLLGLACYTTVAVGLTFDIGIWWRIVFPVFHWHLHSTLFEIAWCIMLYLGVLAVEFSHTVRERLSYPRLLKAVEKVSIVFVILGIALSTLHQSSLGTLFLATPYRLHPLWYSDLLPLLFFITAIGLGCLTITWVALVLHRVYDVEPPMGAISGLARISAAVLGLFLVLRFGDIVLAGKAPLLLVPGWEMANFWLEVLLSAALPVALMSRRRLRESPVAMFWISTSAIVGMSLNRINVAGLATLHSTQGHYFPIWPEWAVTVGLLAIAALAFLYALEHFDVFPNIDQAAVKRAHDPGKLDPASWRTIFFHAPLSSVRLYSLALVLALGFATACLPDNAIYGVEPEKTPTRSPRAVQLQKVQQAPGHISRFVFPAAPQQLPAVLLSDALLIDSDDNGRYVLFEHDAHAARLKEQGGTCASCHHANEPLAQATSCYRCHTDMYLSEDIFSHQAHVEHLGFNAGCVECHADPALAKVEANTTPCATCHPGMHEGDSLVKPANPGQRMGHKAPGYKTAMHELCISCHEKNEGQIEGLAQCTTCHRDTPDLVEISAPVQLTAAETGQVTREDAHR